jgi:MscS family membrane protein
VFFAFTAATGLAKFIPMKIFQLLVVVWLLASNLTAAPESPMQKPPVTPPAPSASDSVITDTPRNTMQSFYSAMEDYKKGLDTEDNKLKERINDALRCFDLSNLSPATRHEEGVQLAIYLKEIIDRTAVLDLSRLPDTAEKPTWKSRSGNFVIHQKQGGDQDGEYLITAESLSRLPDLFEQVKNHPYVKGGGKGAGYQAPWIDRHIPPWAFAKFWGIAYWQWIGLVIVLLLGLSFRLLTRWLFGLSLHLARNTSVKWHSVLIEALTSPLALVVASFFWLLAVYALRFRGDVLVFFTYFVKILLCISLIWTLYRLTHVLHLFLVDYSKREDNRLDEQLVNLITRTLKIIVVVIGVLVAAQNLGVQVFSVLAGLGIGGLAVAMAAKDTLANFFGSIMIMIDRPFRVGHYIKVKDQEGTVEEIGFRSTKIRTPQNSLVSVPSGEIALAPVDNLGLRQFRRVRTTLGITYDTTPEQMVQFIDGIKSIISGNPKCTPNYLVTFTEFNSSSLDVLVNFFLDVPDLTNEAAEKQQIFLAIMKLARQVGVSFAFPSQSLYIEKRPEAKSEK